jgi:lysyl-tRNA synthetase class 2
MDFLVVSALRGARERGVAELSLNFAAFARWLHAPEGAGERLGGAAVRAASRLVQMESLHRFDEKFGPRWEPRHLLYEGRLGLLPTGVAAMRAEGQLALALTRAAGARRPRAARRP